MYRALSESLIDPLTWIYVHGVLICNTAKRYGCTERKHYWQKNALLFDVAGLHWTRVGTIETDCFFHTWLRNWCLSERQTNSPLTGSCPVMPYPYTGLRLDFTHQLIRALYSTCVNAFTLHLRSWQYSNESFYVFSHWALTTFLPPHMQSTEGTNFTFKPALQDISLKRWVASSGMLYSKLWSHWFSKTQCSVSMALMLHRCTVLWCSQLSFVCEVCRHNL